MPVLVDTGVLVAYVNAGDPRHDDAERLLDEVFRGRHGTVATIDLVVAEGLTFLRRRPGRRTVSESFVSLFEPAEGPPPVVVVSTSPDDFSRAKRLHFERYERDLAFTDCMLIHIARRSRGAVLTFDGGFEGEVDLIR